jgi:hypothetical protein
MGAKFGFSELTRARSKAAKLRSDARGFGVSLSQLLKGM